MNKPGRLLTAMVTPFEVGGAIDYQQAKKLAKSLLDSGSDGLVVSGTTGETPTLSREEKLRLFAETKSAVANRGTVVAGTGNYDTRVLVNDMSHVARYPDGSLPGSQNFTV